MERRVIGLKAEYNIITVVLMLLGGVALVVGGILFYILVMQGAIGGAVTGGTVAGGAALFMVGIKSKTLPSELVYIDANTVYFPKNSISIGNINNVISKGNGITIIPINGKKIMQGFLKNSEECCQQIRAAMQAYRLQQQR